MRELIKKYWTLPPPEERYEPIWQVDDILVVNFDCLYERDCSIRAMDQLLYQLHKHGRNKRFLFISEDGANIELTGAIHVIKNIIDEFNLNSDSCGLVCREKLTITNCQVLCLYAVPKWCKTVHQYGENIVKELPSPPFKKKFAVWFHRGTFFRCELAKYLKENYEDDSYISYQEPGIIIDKAMQKYFQQDKEWAEANTPIVYDKLFENRVYDYNDILGPRHPYNDYFLEIVAETNILTPDWITEKTVKNLWFGKPFIVYSAPGTLARLKEHGFLTFHPYIDESYDKETNTYKRLEMIKREIDRLSHADINQLWENIRPILINNRGMYEAHLSRR